jgi:polyhydroxybutyrate depolymerase
VQIGLPVFKTVFKSPHQIPLHFKIRRMRIRNSLGRSTRVLATAALSCWFSIGDASLRSATAADVEPTTLSVKVGDLQRTALVFAPTASSAEANPLVFVFHGHGGNARQASAGFGIQQLWPEAIVVYPQGVPTPGRLTDPEGKRNGWQHGLGDQSDRDLEFFDALLAKLKTDQHVDEKRIYVTGHSNGGAFTFLLWVNRGDVFAAIAPSAAAMSPQMKKPKPLPVLELAGENDALVKYEWQRATMDHVKKINGCDQEGKPAGEFSTEYPSAAGTPFVSYIHPGGHQFPKGAPQRIVEFFKQHAKP